VDFLQGANGRNERDGGGLHCGETKISLKQPPGSACQTMCKWLTEHKQEMNSCSGRIKNRLVEQKN
jgi:hypothetical protein